MADIGGNMKRIQAWGAAGAFIVILGACALSPSVARANPGLSAAVSYGGTHVKSANDDDWRPMLRIEGGWTFVRMLQLAAFLQLSGKDAFLTDTKAGGGLALRFILKIPLIPIAPFADATAGRLRMPDGDHGEARAWMTSIGGGLAFYFLKFTGIRLGMERQWLFGINQSDAMGDKTWTVRGAVFLIF